MPSLPQSKRPVVIPSDSHSCVSRCRAHEAQPRGWHNVVATDALAARSSGRAGRGTRGMWVSPPIRHREFTRRCFMELRASESVRIESSTGFESSAALNTARTSRKQQSSSMYAVNRTDGASTSAASRMWADARAARFRPGQSQHSHTGKHGDCCAAQKEL